MVSIRNRSNRKRGQPQRYAEKKTAVVCAELTPTAFANLNQKIAQYDAGLSRQEFLERLAKGLLDRDRFLLVFFPSSFSSPKD